jgi:beta-phosphoglucomutase-like phosphatase (HAD superfamily)
MSRLLLDALDPALLGRPGWIFDCDGTLARTMRLHQRSWMHAIERQIGRPFDFDWAFFCSMGGMSAEDTCLRLRERHGLALDVTLIRAHTDEWLQANLESNVEGRPEVIAVLEHVHSRGSRTAVASGGTREHVTLTLRKLELLPRLHAVVTCEDAPRSKPHPDLFLEAARRIGMPPACPA